MLEPSGRTGPRWNDHAFTAGVFVASAAVTVLPLVLMGMFAAAAVTAGAELALVAVAAAGVEIKSRLTGRDRRD